MTYLDLLCNCQSAPLPKHSVGYWYRNGDRCFQRAHFCEVLECKLPYMYGLELPRRGTHGLSAFRTLILEILKISGQKRLTWPIVTHYRKDIHFFSRGCVWRLYLCRLAKNKSCIQLLVCKLIISMEFEVVIILYRNLSSNSGWPKLKL